MSTSDKRPAADFSKAGNRTNSTVGECAIGVTCQGASEADVGARYPNESGRCLLVLGWRWGSTTSEAAKASGFAFCDHRRPPSDRHHPNGRSSVLYESLPPHPRRRSAARAAGRLAQSSTPTVASPFRISFRRSLAQNFHRKDRTISSASSRSPARLSAQRTHRRGQRHFGLFVAKTSVLTHAHASLASLRATCPPPQPPPLSRWFAANKIRLPILGPLLQSRCAPGCPASLRSCVSKTAPRCA